MTPKSVAGDDLLSGESENIEYKLTLPERSIQYVKTVVAFANGEGGRIVFGIEDQTRKVVGFPDDQIFHLEDAITNAIADSCTPLIIPSIAVRDIRGKSVIVVDVAPGTQRPYYIRSLGRERGTFVRVAGTTRLADDAMVRQLLFEGEGISFDKQPCLGLQVTGRQISDLCRDMTKTARENREDRRTVKPVGRAQLLSWGILTQRHGKTLPTNAYAILTGSPRIRSVIQCGVFKGTTRAVFVDRRQYTGGASRLIEEAYRYVLRNIHLGALFQGVYRKDVYEIPADAIRELIINAIVHRSYLDSSSIQVAVYDNRLEITSPGGLPMGQTVDKMKEGYSKIRNEALAEAFAYMGYIEHWGSGIPRVITETREAGLREPEFIDTGTDLRVNIYRKTSLGNEATGKVANGEQTTTWHANGTQMARKPENGTQMARKSDRHQLSRLHLTGSAATIYSLIENKGSVSARDVQKATGLKKRQSLRLLTELIDRQLIVRIGRSRATKYALLSDEEKKSEND